MGRNYKNLREIVEDYFPSADADYELLKVAMHDLGKEKTIKAFKEVFNGWITK